MRKQEVFDGLVSLLEERESFITGDAEHDEIYMNDINVLNAAIKLIMN